MSKPKDELFPAQAGAERETAVQRIEPDSNPGALLRLAVESGADVEKLERLMALQERWQAAQAKREFVAAMTELQSEIPTLERRDTVSYTTAKGRTTYNFASLGSIAEQIRGPMKRHGLTYRFEIGEDADNIKVASIITHLSGHSERSEMSGKADESGGKNPIQSRGSTVTYLQRYTLIAALGLTTANDDTDGADNGAHTDTVTAEHEATLRELIEATGTDAAKFCQWAGVTRLEYFPDAKYAEGVALLKKKEARR